LIPVLEIDDYNPYPSFQPGQKEAVTEILEKFGSGERIIELNAPTASGKSLDLYILGRILSEVYGLQKIVYTTPLVSLVNQLRDTTEFTKMPVLVGKRNYPCGFTDTNAEDCPFNTIEQAISACGGGNPCTDCEHYRAHRIFTKSKFGATTLARYMTAGMAKDCAVLLIDESAGLEHALVERAKTKLPDHFDIRELRSSTVDEIAALSSKLKVVEEQRRNVARELAAYYPAPRHLRDEAVKTAKEATILSRKIDRFSTILDCIDAEEKYLVDSDRNFRLIEGKRAFEKLTSKTSLTILASGTPTTKLFRTPFATVTIAHPIEISRRRCYYTPVGSMNYKQRGSTAPAMANEIEMLHEKYGNKKTMVHCGAYNIAELLYKNMSRDAKRITICQNQQSREIDKSKFLDAKPPRIFLSVKFDEGLDLKGDKYPLNIIAKIPFENISDEFVAHRNKFDNYERYDLNAAVSVMQAAGRCTRTPDDFSATYILDSSWKQFFSRRKALFHPWFLAAYSEQGAPKVW
jgi:Rad3-related DNA helicase